MPLPIMRVLRVPFAERKTFSVDADNMGGVLSPHETCDAVVAAWFFDVGASARADGQQVVTLRASSWDA